MGKSRYFRTRGSELIICNTGEKHYTSDLNMGWWCINIGLVYSLLFHDIRSGKIVKMCILQVYLLLQHCTHGYELRLWKTQWYTVKYNNTQPGEKSLLFRSLWFICWKELLNQMFSVNSKIIVLQNNQDVIVDKVTLIIIKMT